MLRVVTVLALSFTLTGCIGALLDAALLDAGAGMGAADAAMGFAARGAAAESVVGVAARGAAAESIIVSDDVAASFRGVRFRPGLRGPLSESLAELTNNGEQSAVLTIDRQGTIGGNGYAVARLSQTTGMIYSPRGVRLGLVNNQSLLIEYLRSGEMRPIGAVRGFVRNRPFAIFADQRFARPVGQIPANGLVRVIRIAKDGYLIQLETGQNAWVPLEAIALVAILGIDQRICVCGAQRGAIVTKSNRLVRYDRCRTTRTGVDLIADGEVVHVPTNGISEIWEGDVGGAGNPSFRAASLHSLRSGGLIYPAQSEYNLFPDGDPRARNSPDSGLVEAPE